MKIDAAVRFLYKINALIMWLENDWMMSWFHSKPSSFSELMQFLVIFFLLGFSEVLLGELKNSKTSRQMSSPAICILILSFTQQEVLPGIIG